VSTVVIDETNGGFRAPTSALYALTIAENVVLYTKADFVIFFASCAGLC
jgi:hypothetical protein